jgi:uncharacterized spore protein YtfJ
MENMESIVKTTMGEIEKMLTTKTVVGDPMMVDGKTLIPLISVGFGFGAGYGSGKMAAKQEQEGIGEGTGGGAGIRPIAVIVSDQEGVRIEPIKGGLASAMEKLGEKILPSLVDKMGSQSPKEGSNK